MSLGRHAWTTHPTASRVKAPGLPPHCMPACLDRRPAWTAGLTRTQPLHTSCHLAQPSRLLQPAYMPYAQVTGREWALITRRTSRPGDRRRASTSYIRVSAADAGRLMDENDEMAHGATRPRSARLAQRRQGWLGGPCRLLLRVWGAGLEPIHRTVRLLDAGREL